MKCTPLLIKAVIFICAISLIAGCSSKSSKKNVNKQQSVSVFNKDRVVTSVTDIDKKKYKKALVYLQTGELLRAEKILKSISVKYPRMAGPYINLGIISMKEARWKDAEKLLISAKSLSPNNPEIYNYLGVTYRQQGRFNEAKNIYQQAIAQDEQFSSAYLNLGILFDLYLSDYVMAKKYYQEYKKLVPGDQNIDSWLIDIDQRIQASN